MPGKADIIMVHQYKLNGYNIVLDTSSGAIHSTDEVAYDMIALYPNSTENEAVSRLLKKYAGEDGVTEDLQHVVDSFRND